MNRFKYLFCLHKAYLDKGMTITNYAKFLIYLFGLSSRDILITMLLGIAFGICSYFIGMIWWKKKLQEAETEVYNLQNPFVHEVRENIVHYNEQGGSTPCTASADNNFLRRKGKVFK